MPRFIDLSGQKFGRLTVVSRAVKGPRAWWNCKCDCGTEKIVSATGLRCGTQSCGCFQVEKHLKMITKHGHAPTEGKAQSKTYATWRGMKSRCLDSGHPKFADYGGRGIKICDSWLHFENFLADMGEKPKGLEIDRIDNSGNYCKENCRWTTKSLNNRNRRNNHFLTLNNESKTIAEWSDVTGIGWHTIYYRFYKLGWSIERSLSAPVSKGPTS